MWFACVVRLPYCPMGRTGSQQTGTMRMIRDDLPPAMRRKILWIAGAFAMAGCFALWLGLSGMMPFSPVAE